MWMVGGVEVWLFDSRRGCREADTEKGEVQVWLRFVARQVWLLVSPEIPTVRLRGYSYEAVQ